jgi:heme A synthase
LGSTGSIPVLTTKIKYMKRIGVFLIVMIIMVVGIGSLTYYIASPISLFSIFIGIVGYMLIVSPALGRWNKFFKDLYLDDEKND